MRGFTTGDEGLLKMRKICFVKKKVVLVNFLDKSTAEKN